MKCENCKHWFDNGTNLSSCDRDALLRERDFFCAAWERKKPFERPYTNADRIRSMTDEELAKWLNCMQSNAYHCGEFGRTNAAYPYDNKAWLDWLKATVKEG